jgi:5-methyltetrahydrofolate--homocysteine methyltransferase
VGGLVVTAGIGVRERAEQLKEQGDYVRSHMLQSIALETAEGLAELVHQMMRARAGYPDALELSMKQRLQARYQGMRVSFGYPACPDLADQAKLFALLQPEQAIGVQLTDGFMMDPEASVSALVFAHPEARYFNVEQIH